MTTVCFIFPFGKTILSEKGFYDHSLIAGIQSSYSFPFAYTNEVQFIQPVSVRSEEV
jgi:hypothetical protein